MCESIIGTLLEFEGRNKDSTRTGSTALAINYLRPLLIYCNKRASKQGLRPEAALLNSEHSFIHCLIDTSASKGVAMMIFVTPYEPGSSGMFKNQLQELAQRSCFNLPSYACIREGPDHAPRFKATVTFNGESFESPGFYPTLRQAEHAAAEVALNELSKRGPSSSLAAKVLDETGIYKNLLQETAHRAGLKLPMYTTIRSGPGHTPTFTCTVELAGRIFTGNPGKTKKQAQKNAAMVAWSELKQLPLVGEAASSSSPSDHDEEQEQVTVTRTLENLNRKNEGKASHQKEKQQSNNRPQSRRSYPKPYVSFYGSHLQNQMYPNVAPEQAMYHMWNQVQATQQKPQFTMVPNMGNTRFQPPPTMRSMYPSPPRGQFVMPASQDALALLPCFPEAAPVLPRYFSPYPASYVPRSPLPVTVHTMHRERQGYTETVELPDASVLSGYTALDSSSTPENVGPSQVQQWPENGKEVYTESSAASVEENKAPQTLSSSTAHPPSQKVEPNKDNKESKKPVEQPAKLSLSCVGSSVVQRPVQRQGHPSPVQHGEPTHRSNLPFSRATPPELWSLDMQAPARYGAATPMSSSARPNAAVNSNPGAAARAGPAVQILSREDPEAHRNTRHVGDASTASSELNKLHISEEAVVPFAWWWGGGELADPGWLECGVGPEKSFSGCGRRLQQCCMCATISLLKVLL
uniref:Ribonuclease 3 n=1 Tax=Aegilops tauschii TaxID=37682 RepID=N1R4V7_AEGTA